MSRIAPLLVLAALSLPSLAHAQLDDGSFNLAEAQALAALEGDVGLYLGPLPDHGGQQGEDLADGGQTGSEIESGTDPLGGLVTSPLGFFEEGTAPPDSDPSQPLQGLVTNRLGFFDIFVPFRGQPGVELLVVGSDGDHDGYVLGGACKEEPCYAGRRVLASASRSEDELPDGRVAVTITVVASAPSVE